MKLSPFARKWWAVEAPKRFSESSRLLVRKLYWSNPKHLFFCSLLGMGTTVGFPFWEDAFGIGVAESIVCAILVPGLFAIWFRSKRVFRAIESRLRDSLPKGHVLMYKYDWLEKRYLPDIVTEREMEVLQTTHNVSLWDSLSRRYIFPEPQNKAVK